MSVLIRIILVLALLVQTVPGLAAPACAGMEQSGKTAGTVARSDEECPCCVVDDPATASCPVVADTAVCRCGEVSSQEQTPPQSDPRSEQVRQLLVPIPGAFETPVPVVTKEAARRPCSDPAPHRTSNTIQSLLCVWVV